MPLGHASFKLRGKTATVVTDPYDGKMLGQRYPAVSADIVTISHNHADHNAAEAVEGTPMVLAAAGEYEIKGVRITAISTFHDAERGAKRGKNLLWHFQIDGVGILHCGDLGHKLSDSEVDEIPSVDILLVPIGGVYTIDVKEAALLLTQLDPKIVIPMHYRLGEDVPEAFRSLATVAEFLKEVGKTAVTPQSKLMVSRDKLPTELQVVVLE